jgi:hypothetical protein
MSWLDDLLGKQIRNGDTILPDRKILRFIPSSATISIEDNPSTVDGEGNVLGSTDVTLDGAGPALSIVTDQVPTLAESGTRYYNPDASGAITISLPANPVIGTSFHGRVLAAFALIFDANVGQRIRYGADLGASSGNIQSSFVGATISLEAVSASLWIVTVSSGPWDLS